ncbi:MucBP domain-containing protein, partial [Lactococcus lactis]
VAGGDVTAKYVDTDGNKISDDVIKSGNVGDSYTTDQKTIAGYTFKEVQGSATGTFTDQAQTVTYIYTKNNIPVNSISPQSSSNSTSRMNNTTTSNSLPRTGEQQGITVLMFILGISLIGVSLILAFFKNVKNN